MMFVMRVAALTLYIQLVSTSSQTRCEKVILGLYHGVGMLNFSSSYLDTDVNVTLTSHTAEEIHSGANLSVVTSRAEGLTIEMWNVGVCCDRELVLSLLISKGIFQHSGPCEVAIFGPSCSGIAFTLAQLIQKIGVTSLKYFNISPLPMPLAAELREASILTLIPPVDRLADVGVALVRHANWSQILALYEDDDMNLVYTFNRLQYLLRREDEEKEYDTDVAEGACTKITRSTLAASAIVRADGHLHLEGILQNHETKIVFLFLTADRLKSFLCRHKLNGEKATQWVIFKTSFEEILSLEDNRAGCSKDDIHFILQMAIAIGYNSSTRYAEHILHRVIEMEVRGKNASPPDPLFVYQFGQDVKTVGIYHSSLTIYEHSEPIFNSSNFRKVYKFLNLGGFSFAVVLIIALFVCTLVTHALFIYYWNSKSVRATGRKLQQLTLMGIYMLTAAMLIYLLLKGLDFGNAHPYFCMVLNVMSSFSMSTLVSSLAMHHWRLYRIFHSYMKPGEMLSNWFLFLQSMALSAFPLLVCCVWLLVDSPIRQETACVVVPLERVKIVSLECGYKHFYLFVILIIGYNIALLLATSVLYLKTKLDIPKSQVQFRHRNIVLLFYICVFILGVGFPLYAFSSYINNTELEVYTAVSIQTLLIVVFLFFLFVYPVYLAANEKKSWISYKFRCVIRI